MDNLKGLMKMVKAPDKLQGATKVTNGYGTNLKAMKKELEKRMNEKLKIYGFIGMETYDLIKQNKLSAPQLDNYMEKMDELNQGIEELEQLITEQELKNRGKNVCACGYKLKVQDRFCPNCGEAVPRDTVICQCGAEVGRDTKFCSSCGKSMEEIISFQEESRKPSMKECICGAKVPAGQFMCLECGRKVE